MTAGWQVLCFLAAFVLFIVAAIVAATRRPYWPTLIAIGLAVLTLVSLWNANAVYD